MLGLYLAAVGFLVVVCVLALVSIEQDEPKTVFHNNTSRFSVYDAWDYLDGI
jgi:hypothetical protein